MSQPKPLLLRMLIDKSIQPLPVGLFLQASEVTDAIEIRLISRMYSHLLTISLQFDMTGGLLVGAMPIERLVHKGDASMQLGTNGKNRVV